MARAPGCHDRVYARVSQFDAVATVELVRNAVATCVLALLQQFPAALALVFLLTSDGPVELGEAARDFRVLSEELRGRCAPARAERSQRPDAPARLRGALRVACRCFPKRRELCRGGRPLRRPLDGPCGGTTDQGLVAPRTLLLFGARMRPPGRLEPPGRPWCASNVRCRCKGPQYLAPQHGFAGAHGRAGGRVLEVPSATVARAQRRARQGASPRRCQWPRTDGAVAPGPREAGSCLG